MELWTVQNEHVMDDLSSGKPYRVKEEMTWPYECLEGVPSPEPGTYICYKWMADRLRRKAGPAPEGTRFPVWAWYRFGDRLGKFHPGKPDMRRHTTNEPEKVVRLRLEVPDDKVLLSNYETWHIPLNRGYMDFFRAGSDAFDAWCEEVGIARFHHDIWDFSNQGHQYREARRRIFKSWERVLDIDPEDYDPDWVGDIARDDIQAVFWEILPEYIVSAEHFTTRRAARW